MSITQKEKSELLAEFTKASKVDVDLINKLVTEKLGAIDVATKRLDQIETIMNRPDLSSGAPGSVHSYGDVEPEPGNKEGPSPGQNKSDSFPYEVKSEYDKAFFDTYLRMGQSFLAPEESKALILGSDPAAGYLTSVEYGREIIKAITEFSPIRAHANVKPTRGTEISFPRRSALPDTHWQGETSERVEDESLDHVLEKLTPHEMTSLKKLSLQQIEDSIFNMASELGEAFGEAFGLKEGTGFISGSGVTQPEGILTNPDVGLTETITASVLSADDIMSFPYTLAPGYRRRGKWYMNDIIIAKIRLMRADMAVADDNLGPFLWRDSLVAGQPPTLGGFPVISCPDMGSTVGDDDVVAVFGDMKKAYMIVDRIQITIQPLRERYAEFGLVGYLARKRVDGQVVLPAAIRKLGIQGA